MGENWRIARYLKKPAGTYQRYRLMLVAATDFESVFEWTRDQKPMAVSPDAGGSCDTRLWPRSRRGIKATEGVTDAQCISREMICFRTLIFPGKRRVSTMLEKLRESEGNFGCPTVFKTIKSIIQYVRCFYSPTSSSDEYGALKNQGYCSIPAEPLDA